MNPDNNRRQAGSNRSALGYWIPLAITVTVATAGLVAWIWKERNDNEELDYDRVGRPPPPSRPGYTGPSQSRDGNAKNDNSMFGKMQGALGRAPSPSQIMDGAGRRVAAASAAVGAALGYEDHNRWSEEADKKSRVRSKKRKAVAIVLSAEEIVGQHAGDSDHHAEQASILSHLSPNSIEDAQLYVLIYAPKLGAVPIQDSKSSKARTMSSSYEKIDRNEVSQSSRKPLTILEPKPLSSSIASGGELFQTLKREALGLVSRETMVMPFSSPTSYLPILRHINPEVVYVQTPLAGAKGENVKNLANWVGQVVLVVGDETGHGGLVDSEDERAHHGDALSSQWWAEDPKVGLGKGIEVVEGLRISEDWRRRVRGHD